MNDLTRQFSDEETREMKRKHFENLARIGKDLEEEWAQWETLTPEQRTEQENVCMADIHFNVYRWQKRGNLTGHITWWLEDGAAGILLFDPEEVREAERMLQAAKVSINQEAQEAGKPLPFPEIEL
jgi:hypothetical protein